MQIPANRHEKDTNWVLQFINIVFLILLYFMINGTIASPPPRGIIPPVAILSDVADPPQRALYIDRDGGLSYLGRRLSLAEFEKLYEMAQNDPDAPQAIVADRWMAATALIEVVSRLQAKGLPVLPVITLRGKP